MDIINPKNMGMEDTSFLLKGALTQFGRDSLILGSSMDMVGILDQMETVIPENIKIIWNMGMAYTFGITGICMKGLGFRITCMVLEAIFTPKPVKQLFQRGTMAE